MKQSFEERFHSKYIKLGPDECWIWLAAKSHSHGMVYYKGRNRTAHRVAYMLDNKSLDIGSYDTIHHHCGNPACVNPAHLYQGSHILNLKRVKKNKALELLKAMARAPK